MLNEILTVNYRSRQLTPLVISPFVTVSLWGETDNWFQLLLFNSMITEKIDTFLGRNLLTGRCKILKRKRVEMFEDVVGLLIVGPQM